MATNPFEGKKKRSGGNPFAGAKRIDYGGSEPTQDEDVFTLDNAKRAANTYFDLQRPLLGPLGYVAPDPFEVKAKEQLSRSGAIAKGAVHGINFGFDEENAGVRDAARKLLTEGDTNVVENYRKRRDEETAANDATRKNRKGAFLVGEIGGGVVTPGGPGKNLLASILKGAGAGALHGAGESRADLTKGETEGLAEDVARGTAFGAGGGAIGHGVAKAIGAVAKPFRRAEENAKDILRGEERVAFDKAAKAHDAAEAKRIAGGNRELRGLQRAEKERAQIVHGERFGVDRRPPKAPKPPREAKVKAIARAAKQADPNKTAMQKQPPEAAVDDLVDQALKKDAAKNAPSPAPEAPARPKLEVIDGGKTVREAKPPDAVVEHRVQDALDAEAAQAKRFAEKMAKPKAAKAQQPGRADSGLRPDGSPKDPAHRILGKYAKRKKDQQRWGRDLALDRERLKAGNLSPKEAQALREHAGNMEKALAEPGATQRALRWGGEKYGPERMEREILEQFEEPLRTKFKEAWAALPPADRLKHVSEIHEKLIKPHPVNIREQIAGLKGQDRVKAANRAVKEGAIGETTFAKFAGIGGGAGMGNNTANRIAANRAQAALAEAGGGARPVPKARGVDSDLEVARRFYDEIPGHSVDPRVRAQNLNLVLQYKQLHRIDPPAEILEAAGLRLKGAAPAPRPAPGGAPTAQARRPSLAPAPAAPPAKQPGPASKFKTVPARAQAGEAGFDDVARRAGQPPTPYKGPDVEARVNERIAAEKGGFGKALRGASAGIVRNILFGPKAMLGGAARGAVMGGIDTMPAAQAKAFGRLARIFETNPALWARISAALSAIPAKERMRALAELAQRDPELKAALSEGKR